MNNKKATGKNPLQKNHFLLTLIFSAITFINFLLTLLLVVGVFFILVKTGILSFDGDTVTHSNHLILLMAAMSAGLGFIAAEITITFLFKPIRKIITAMNCLACGDYSVRLNFAKPMSKIAPLSGIADSFNSLAEELESTEMLRSDFVNNFSHEFKTPIVSISGFAKLLKKGNLSKEQEKEYVDIIEEESLRLSYMATNVLNLTKIENQAILSGVDTYNLSEQIRSCILLLESKWTKKNLELHIDFGEYNITASEELLKQMWINLLDNAIKFSPEYGIVEVDIDETDTTVVVSVLNTGKPIPKEKQDKIFNKFYQADTSHSCQGNGIGLAVVKRVCDLHKGSVTVSTKKSMTCFTVTLPKG